MDLIAAIARLERIELVTLGLVVVTLALVILALLRRPRERIEGLGVGWRRLERAHPRVPATPEWRQRTMPNPDNAPLVVGDRAEAFMIALNASGLPVAAGFPAGTTFVWESSAPDVLELATPDREATVVTVLKKGTIGLDTLATLPDGRVVSGGVNLSFDDAPPAPDDVIATVGIGFRPVAA